MSIRHVRTRLDGFSMFHREAGDPEAPALVLVHGFPSSSHMFRTLLPELAGAWRVIAPDLPGFGFSDLPHPDVLPATFDGLARALGRFLEAIGLERYALYVFDYGAPVALRVAVEHPERVTALVSQNGNAYEEGLGEGFAPLRRAWAERTPEARDALRALLTETTTRFQYEHGVRDAATRIAPEAPFLDQTFLDVRGRDAFQLDLLVDYGSNLAWYPRFQAFFRAHRPPTLAIWGEDDPFFLPAGAEAYRRDNPAAQVRFVPGGHFALETESAEIGRAVRAFLDGVLRTAGPAAFASAGARESASAVRALARVHETFGFVPALARAMAAEPAALEGYLDLLAAVDATSLDPVERQVVMAEASRTNEAPYGVAVHATLAARAGASGDVVRALREGTALPDPRLESLRVFTGAVVRGRGQLPEPAIRRFLQGGRDARALVAVLLAVAAKTFANGVAHLARPAIDEVLR